MVLPRHRAWLLALMALTVGLAQAEPPDWPGLRCQVTQQRVVDGAQGAQALQLEVEFSNATAEALSLPAGAHLVWYRDAAAEEPMDPTVRAGRVQDVPLLLPAAASRSALLAFAPALLDGLRCNGSAPAAAALYFYQFNPMPRFRCRLQGYALQALAPKPGCAGTPRP